MKKVLALSFLAILTGCAKQKAIEFDIPYTTEFTITTGGITINTPIDFTTPDVPTTIGPRMIENKTDIQFIDEIKYTKFDITATLPSGQKLDFLKSISLYMNAEGQKETLVASKDPVPVGDSTVAMDLPNVNLKNFITKDKFKLRALIVPDATLSQSVTISITQNVHVKAKQFLK